MSVINCNIHRYSFTLNFVRRQVHLSSVRGKNVAVHKQAKVLAKLMTGAHRKKKNWYRQELMAKTPVAPSSKSFQTGTQSKRRVDVLNKLFMRSITDLLATGDVPELLGLGITITGVKVVPDFSTVNVYWFSKQIVPDKILIDAGFKLRHQLCQLHVMGIVPKICFVADKWHVINEEALQILEKTKSQDGYEAEDVAEKFKSKYVLIQPVDPEVLDKIEDLKDDLDPLPPMIHNALGLDHAAIMSKIKAALKKSEASHRQNTTSEDDSLSLLQFSDGNLKAKGQDIDSSSYISRYIAKKRIEEKRALKVVQKELLAEAELQSQLPEENDVDSEDGDFLDENDYVTKEKFWT